MFRRTLAFLAAGLLAVPAAAGELGMGDPAPALQVQWVKGEPVASLAADKTYVVEFWATWCGPCRKSIPHLTELQKEYGDRVTFIGVSVWESDQADVAPFVEKMGDQMAYRVAMDRVDADEEGAMATSWMKAAGQRGIPAAFIVEGGKIAWIGHPQAMDEALAAVVDGTYDLASAKEAMEREGKSKALFVAVQEAAQKGEWQEALAKMDELQALDPKMELYVGPTRYVALLGIGQPEKAAAYGKAYVSGAAKDEPSALNALAWSIVDPEGGLEHKDLDLALAAATRADEVSEGKDPQILDTLARVWFEKGDVAKAIELQEKAVELAKGTSWEKELERTLEEYRGEAKS